MGEQPEFRPPNFTIQEASQYKSDIDSSIALLGRIAAAFAPHEKPSIAEVSTVQTVADVAGNLDGTYFTLSAPSEDFYVFLNSLDTSGIPDPGLSGATGIQVDYSDNDSAATIAAAINVAVDAEALLNSSVIGDIVTISNRDQGAVTDIADGLSGNATGFGLVVVTQGGDGPTDLQVNIDAGYVLNDPEASGGSNNGIDEITSQIISEGSGSILAPTTNPRIDRIVIDIETGVAELVTGTESASPVPPDLPRTKSLNCQFRLETSTTIITNSLITDERTIQNNYIYTKDIKIGDWDMDADNTKSIPHGLSNRFNIRSVAAWIKADVGVAGALIHNLESVGTTGIPNGAASLADGVNITLGRTNSASGGRFDDPDFDATPFNRGWVLIHYSVG